VRGGIVHDSRAYPRLLRLFGELGVATRDTDMSMSVHCRGCGLEYAGSRGPLGLAEEADYLVTLNDAGRVRSDRVLARMTYGHPVYTAESVAAQQRLATLNTPVIAYAGAYHGCGFHEDGCRSGAQAARSLGVAWVSAALYTGRDGTLVAVVAEVHNTYGQRHAGDAGTGLAGRFEPIANA
jgi:predicted NAD/FAD-binding protein